MGINNTCESRITEISTVLMTHLSFNFICVARHKLYSTIQHIKNFKGNFSFLYGNCCQEIFVMSFGIKLFYASGTNGNIFLNPKNT